jgi:hypothetical protein
VASRRSGLGFANHGRDEIDDVYKAEYEFVDENNVKFDEKARSLPKKSLKLFSGSPFSLIKVNIIMIL